jgi:peptide/nickel transport system substrate-binding protein
MVQYGNQEHDLIRCTPEQYKKLLDNQDVMKFSNNYKFFSPYAGYSYIGWNQKKKSEGKDVTTPFDDKRVRQAMTMLVDRERMAREIFLGYATVATGPFAPKGLQADQSIKPWPYDVARATKLLAEAGYEDRNKDGVIEGPDGQPFKFKLTYPSGAEIYEKMVLFLRDNFARGGIIMEPERLDWPVLLNRLSHSDFDAVILGWSAVPESDIYQEFHSSQIAGEGDNRTSYVSAALDKTIEEARKTMDTKKRMQLWHTAHQILHEDQPYTFMFNRDRTWLINKKIHNIEPAAVGLNFEYLNGGMIPWFIPTGEQKRPTQ